MTKKGFTLPMNTSEKVFGWIYLALHIFFIPFGTSFLYAMLERGGIIVPEKYFNLICYGIGFILILIFMHHYMKSNFHLLCDNVFGSLRAILTGYAFYYILMYLLSSIMFSVAGETVNPNDDAIVEQFRQNRNVVFAVAAIVGPIVEEVLFRGVVFGTIRKKSRWLAYTVSIVLFAFYHLWSYFIEDYQPTLFFELVNYIPGGLVLAWTYENSRNIWAPIALHMFINFFALSVSISFLG